MHTYWGLIHSQYRKLKVIFITDRDRSIVDLRVKITPHSHFSLGMSAQLKCGFKS